MSHPTIIQTVSDYYSEKINTHGPTHQGVDWNSTESQEVRFHQLLRGFSLELPFTINDLGCGYGAMVSYLKTLNIPYTYSGYDVSPEMVTCAIDQFNDDANVSFIQSDSMQPADYTVASGIFNVRLQCGDEDWNEYIQQTLHQMDKASTKGFSFNILTSYSDEPYKRDYLHYADPSRWFDYCKQHFSRNVALFHDYDLYEFTISVQKSANG